MEAVVHPDPSTLADAAANAIAGLVAGSEGRYSVGFAGGSTPTPTYQRLLDRDVEWARVDAWLSDERWVPPDHERCNGLMVAEVLLDHVPASFHRPPLGEPIDPETAASRYENVIREIHPESGPDLILLGIGGDGHTASLFPDTTALNEKSRWFVANYVPQEGEMRLTATFPLLWSAKDVLFLVTGEDKAEAVKESFEGKTPAGRVGEGTGRVIWHLDTAAASLLS